MGTTRGILSDTMMSRQWSVAILLLLTESFGCRRPQKPMIAVIPETTAQEAWESAHSEASRIAATWNWDTFWNGPSREDDLRRQIQIVDEEVDRGAAGIILAPDHAVALISPVRAAVAKNIPVAIIDNPLAAFPKEDVLFVLNDHVATGRMAANRVSRYLKGKHNEVAIIGVHPSFLGTITIADTFKRALQQYDPDISIVEQRTTLGFSEAESSADELLQKKPKLRAIVTLNAVQTRAVYDALSRAKLTGKIALIGCEQDFDTIYRVRTGEIDSIIAIDTRTMVRDAMQWIHERRRGAVTSETIIVEPRLVTKQNVDSSDMQHILAVSGEAP